MTNIYLMVKKLDEPLNDKKTFSGCILYPEGKWGPAMFDKDAEAIKQAYLSQMKDTLDRAYPDGYEVVVVGPDSQDEGFLRALELAEKRDGAEDDLTMAHELRVKR